MAQEIYELGRIPDLGVVPPKMYAQLIRAERFGERKTAFQLEQVPAPETGPRDVLVYVMASGVNYNNVWAAPAILLNAIKARQKAGEKEHVNIGSSDANGIVWKVGKDVTSVKVGDEVVVHCSVWSPDDSHVKAGKDLMLAASTRIWDYETNWGSFAQHTKVQDHQCLPKPERRTWEEAAAYTLVCATAYRMLHGWAGDTVQPREAVLFGELKNALQVDQVLVPELRPRDALACAMAAGVNHHNVGTARCIPVNAIERTAQGAEQDCKPTLRTNVSPSELINATETKLGS